MAERPGAVSHEATITISAVTGGTSAHTGNDGNFSSLGGRATRGYEEDAHSGGLTVNDSE